MGGGFPCMPSFGVSQWLKRNLCIDFWIHFSEISSFVKFCALSSSDLVIWSQSDWHVPLGLSYPALGTGKWPKGKSHSECGAHVLFSFSQDQNFSNPTCLVGSSESSIVSYILFNFYCYFQQEGFSKQGILSVPALKSLTVLAHISDYQRLFYFFLSYIL